MKPHEMAGIPTVVPREAPCDNYSTISHDLDGFDARSRTGPCKPRTRVKRVVNRPILIETRYTRAGFPGDSRKVSNNETFPIRLYRRILRHDRLTRLVGECWVNGTVDVKPNHAIVRFARNILEVPANQCFTVLKQLDRSNLATRIGRLDKARIRDDVA